MSKDARAKRRLISAVGAATAAVTMLALAGCSGADTPEAGGDVTLELPSTLDADLSMRSVSGRIDSDFQMTLNGRMDRRRLEARIGKGGRDLDVTTVSGDLRLRMAK